MTISQSGKLLVKPAGLYFFYSRVFKGNLYTGIKNSFIFEECIKNRAMFMLNSLKPTGLVF